MKQLITAFSFLLLATNTNAQKNEDDTLLKRTEISFSYGTFTNAQLLEIIRLIGFFDSNEYDATKFTGGIFLTIRRSTANDKFRFGIAAGYDGTKGTFTNFVTGGSGSYTSKHITFAAEGMFNYMNKPNMRLYGFLGAGYTNINYKRVTTTGSVTETSSSGIFNFQFTPIGVAFGGRFGGFLELGLGYKGIINLGAYARF